MFRELVPIATANRSDSVLWMVPVMSSDDARTAKMKAVFPERNCRDAKRTCGLARTAQASGIKSGSTVVSKNENAREIGRLRFLVRKGGLEPPRYCYRQPLKLGDLLC